MDLNLCYRNFVVDDRELMFHSVLGTVPSFHDEEGNLYCAAAAFQHPDGYLARRFPSGPPTCGGAIVGDTRRFELFTAAG